MQSEIQIYLQTSDLDEYFPDLSVSGAYKRSIFFETRELEWAS